MSLANDIRTPFRSGNVLMQLIIVNVAVFIILNFIRLSLFFSGYKGEVLDMVFHLKITQYIGMPMNFDHFIYRPWTIFTYMFTQIEIGHLFWNMVFIYMFGTILQEFIGNSRTLAIYLYSGILGGLLTLLLHSTVLIEQSYMPIIGASGSVMGIVLAAATLVPDKTIMLLFLGPVKLIYIALFYVVVDLIGVTYIDGVGHIAHLGGALMGFLFVRALRSGKDLSKPVNKIFYGGKRIVTFQRQRKPKMKVVKNAYTTSMGRDTGNSESKVQIQRRIDSILDKISKGGYESLSKEEKDYLFTHGKDI